MPDEIGFYHLTRSALENALPRLLEIVLARGHKVIIVTGSEARMTRLNEVLWTYEQRSWLPHGLCQDDHAARQPILITDQQDDITSGDGPPNGADVLVALDGVTLSEYGMFKRLLDMFDGGDEAAVAAARKRWKYYRDAGETVSYWRQTDQGSWEKQA